jgi:hypothetical protein
MPRNRRNHPTAFFREESSDYCLIRTFLSATFRPEAVP